MDHSQNELEVGRNEYTLHLSCLSDLVSPFQTHVFRAAMSMQLGILHKDCLATRSSRLLLMVFVVAVVAVVAAAVVVLCCLLLLFFEDAFLGLRIL